LVRTRSGGDRRGATEHWYRAVGAPVFDEAEWAALSQAERREISDQVIELLLGDTHRAGEAGTFDARPDRQLTRQIPTVDEQGFAKVIAIMESAFRQVNDAEAASAARMAESGEAGIPMTVGMLAFERAPR
jgi:hypothetical protein